MIDLPPLDARPLIVAIAGPNGAGKTTFYFSHLERLALPVVNADTLARELDLGPYEAVQAADRLRRGLVERRASFVFETVFSDPVGDKVAFLEAAAAAGYTVVLCFIGISSAAISEQRVAMRVSQGGHDVPNDKIEARFPRTLANFSAAIRKLQHVLVYDNDSLNHPYRFVAAFEQGRLVSSEDPIPAWLQSAL